MWSTTKNLIAVTTLLLTCGLHHCRVSDASFSHDHIPALAVRDCDVLLFVCLSVCLSHETVAATPSHRQWCHWCILSRKRTPREIYACGAGLLMAPINVPHLLHSLPAKGSNGLWCMSVSLVKWRNWRRWLTDRKYAIE